MTDRLTPQTRHNFYSRAEIAALAMGITQIAAAADNTKPVRIAGNTCYIGPASTFGLGLIPLAIPKLPQQKQKSAETTAGNPVEHAPAKGKRIGGDMVFETLQAVTDEQLIGEIIAEWEAANLLTDSVRPTVTRNALRSWEDDPVVPKDKVLWCHPVDGAVLVHYLVGLLGMGESCAFGDAEMCEVAALMGRKVDRPARWRPEILKWLLWLKTVVIHGHLPKEQTVEPGALMEFSASMNSVKAVRLVHVLKSKYGLFPLGGGLDLLACLPPATQITGAWARSIALSLLHYWRANLDPEKKVLLQDGKLVYSALTRRDLLLRMYRAENFGALRGSHTKRIEKHWGKATAEIYTA